jgi:hypothetical protein
MEPSNKLKLSRISGYPRQKVKGDWKWILEGCNRLAPDTELEVGSKEIRIRRKKIEKAMARKWDEGS